MIRKDEEEKGSNTLVGVGARKELMKKSRELRMSNVDEDHEHEHKLPWSDKD